ncbi:MAG: VirB6/TrbL-like conjugal transfer protein, CD1112 family [Lachnospiraceae bacterium]
MNSLLEKIQEWIKELLIGGITSNFQGMFDEINSKVGEIAGQVGQTPEGFNSGVFSMIKTLSETVILPIAGIVLTFVLCYELIQMIIDKNNMHDFDTFQIYKWIFKTFCAVYILTHTFDIVVGIFEVAQYVVNQSSSVISGSMDVTLAMDELQTTLEAMELGELIGLYLESAILSLAMKAITICIFIVIYGRMMEIYISTSLAPIPFATMVNREWGHTGNNYLKSMCALAFQGFLIMVCVAIYAALLQGITASGDIHTAIWTCAGYTVLLCFTLFKTGSLSKSIFGSH